MNRSNKLILNKADYKDNEDFYQLLFQQIRILVETKQVFTFHENPKVSGMYVLQFAPSKIDNDSSFPVWLDGEEIASITAYSQLRDYQDAQKYIEEFEGSLEKSVDKLRDALDDDDFGYDPINPPKKKKDDDGGDHSA